MAMLMSVQQNSRDILIFQCGAEAKENKAKEIT